MDIHNSTTDVHNSIKDIHNSTTYPEFNYGYIHYSIIDANALIIALLIFVIQ